jgi:multidrug resistance efflux pump
MRAAILPALGLCALLVALLGVLFVQQQLTTVTTDNAHVTGPIVQVAGPAAATVRSLLVEVGDQVSAHQPVAVLSTPSVGFLQLRSPADGIVVARTAEVGDSIPAGRPVVTLVDPGHLWVEAQIDETQVNRVRPGQEVEITVDALGRIVPGRVTSVGAASAGAAAPDAQATGPGFFVKAPQLVPVRIEFLSADGPLVVGGSVFVRIRV